MKRRAFSLLEVAVAMALSVIIIGLAANVMARSVREGLRSRAHADLTRDAAFAGQLFSQELRQAGLGVPNGANVALGSTFYAALIVAAPDQVGIVADLPRVDANYSAYGPMHSRMLDATHVMWHTENNGACAPESAVGGCTTGTTSLFFPGENGCAATTAFGQRTCPWGLRRVLAGERLQVIAGNGTWDFAAFASPAALDQLAAAPGIFAAALSPGFSANWPDPPAPAPAVTSPVEIGGQGWVTTLDRVFFRYNSTDNTIERKQCSGDPDPASTDWPDATAVAIPASPQNVSPLRTANTCSGFEVIARHVQGLTFSYFDASGNPVTPVNTAARKASVRRINYRIQFQAAPATDQRKVKHEVAGSVRLQNIQGP